LTRNGAEVISIGHSVSALEKSERLRQAVFECFRAAIQDSSQYAIELGESLTPPYRRTLDALAAGLSPTEADSLADARAAFRGLLRDYRGQAAAFLDNLRQELAGGAHALEQVLESLNSGDGDSETRVRDSLETLRRISDAPEAAPLRGALLAAADAIGGGFEELRKRHELSVAQFRVEIHLLHQRIDGLERAAMIDGPSRLLSRKEIEDRINNAPPEWYSLLLIRAGGLTAAAARFGEGVAAELAAAFGKRLKGSLPEGSALGRWEADDFVAKVSMTKRDALAVSKKVAESFSGVYSCLQDGKIVRPSLHVTVGVAERDPLEPPPRTCARISVFFAKLA